MSKKVSYSEVSAKLMDLSSASREVYGSFSHVAGYYESTLVGLIADLPAHKQAEMMRIFDDRIKDLRKQA